MATTNYGDACVDKVAEKEVSKIESLFASLRTCLDEMDERIESMTVRLSPVMGVDHPRETCNATKDAEQLSDVANYVATAISRIRGMSRRIDDACQRLEI
jgi:hypothetical protein